MRILVLGGTLFLGRHFVEAALARGHDVTVFTRGKRPLPWPGVAHAVGERDPRREPGLRSIEQGIWDAVVDTSGYVPRCVQASAASLASRTGFYLFVSSMSVYADASRPHVAEDGALAVAADPSSENVMQDYGALKAACEVAVRTVYGERAAIVRPGLIVGPHDPTDRFAYWVARFRAPELLGERADRAIVPGPATRPVQLIDARDLAAWMLDLAERGTSGTFNACSGAGQWTMGDLVAALQEGVPAPRPAWLDDDTLLAHRVTPWTGLPLWLPAAEAEHAGFMAFSCERAHAAGLRTRTLRDTVDATAAWLRTRPTEGTFANVLSGEAERAILAAVRHEASRVSAGRTRRATP